MSDECIFHQAKLDAQAQELAQLQKQFEQQREALIAILDAHAEEVARVNQQANEQCKVIEQLKRELAAVTAERNP